MDKLRVCHLVSGDLWAGAEVMVHHLLRGLARFPDVAPSVVVLNAGRLEQELRRSGIRVHLVEERKHSFPGLLSRVRRILGRERPHVVHSHRYKEHLLAWIVQGTRGRAGLIATQHGMPEPFRGWRARKARLVSAINLAVLRTRFDAVVAVSEEMRRSLVGELGFRDSRVPVIRNGLDTRVFRVLARPDRPEVVIGSCGRLVPVKDYPLLVDIAAAVAQGSRTVRFQLAGEGPGFEDLVRRIGAHRLGDAFVLRGFLADTREFYRDLDVYLNTSRHEGIPMSVLEAMSCGLPVVAPRVGGFPEMIEDGVEGWLVEPGNREAFAERCLELATDPGLRRRMGLAARAKVEKSYSLQAMARSYHDLYRRCAGGPVAGTPCGVPVLSRAGPSGEAAAV